MQGRSYGDGAGGAMWFIGVEVEQETSAPPPTWILQVPSLGLSSIFNFS